MAESRLNPTATNGKDNHGVCRGSYGIFQIGCVHERDVATLYDVEENIRLARIIYDEAKARTGNGWLPWGAYTDGAYQRHLTIR